MPLWRAHRNINAIEPATSATSRRYVIAEIKQVSASISTRKSIHLQHRQRYHPLGQLSQRTDYISYIGELCRRDAFLPTWTKNHSTCGAHAQAIF